MEQFTVRLLDKELIVDPCEDGSGFDIFFGYEHKGKIYAKPDKEHGVVWASDDDIDPELVEMIGELIQQAEM